MSYGVWWNIWGSFQGRFQKCSRRHVIFLSFHIFHGSYAIWWLRTSAWYCSVHKFFVRFVCICTLVCSKLKPIWVYVPVTRTIVYKSKAYKLRLVVVFISRQNFFSLTAVSFYYVFLFFVFLYYTYMYYIVQYTIKYAVQFLFIVIFLKEKRDCLKFVIVCSSVTSVNGGFNGF